MSIQRPHGNKAVITTVGELCSFLANLPADMKTTIGCGEDMEVTPMRDDNSGKVCLCFDEYIG